MTAACIKHLPDPAGKKRDESRPSTEFTLAPSTRGARPWHVHRDKLSMDAHNEIQALGHSAKENKHAF